MFKEILKFREEEKNISSLKYDDHLRKNFSSWVKQYEKSPKRKKKYENYFNSFKGKGRFSEEDYISMLLSLLTKLYFHCELSFPIVDVDFNTETLFNHEKMIDLFTTGIRKVDFIILPSLFSIGIYLENEKSWVLTYQSETFKFGKLTFEDLVNKQEKYIYPLNREATGSKFYQSNNQNIEQNKQVTSSIFNQSKNLNIEQNRQNTASIFNKSNNQKIEQNRRVTGSKFYLSQNKNLEQNRQTNGYKIIIQNKILDNFTTKDIQEENKEITKIFQKEALNYLDDNEEIENENIAKFLIKAANISKRAYNNSNELFINI